MKRNNLYDFLIILFVHIAFSSIPFINFIPNISWLIFVLQILCQVLLFIFDSLFLKKSNLILTNSNKFSFLSTLILLPTFICTVSNYFYLLKFNPANDLSFSTVDLILEIVLALTIAINEERVFRLILINNLESKNNIVRILISAMAFGLAHIVTFLSSFNPVDLIQIVYTFGIGLLLGVFYIYGGSIITCVILHFLFNVFNNVLFSKFLFNSMNYGYFIFINAIIAVFIGIYVLMFIILKRSKNKELKA